MGFIPENIIARLLELNVEETAIRLGDRVVRHKSFCFKHTEKIPSLSFHPNGKIWKCFSCGIHGANAISYVMEREEVDFLTACNILCQLYNISYPNYSSCHFQRYTYTPRKYYFNKVEESIFNYNIGERIIADSKLSILAKHFLFNERCLSPAVIEKQQIKSISNSEKLIDYLVENFPLEKLIEAAWIKVSGDCLYLRFFTPALLFPYFDINNNLIGIQTRYIGSNNKAPRFQFISGFKPSIYNLPILNSLERGDELFIAEGVTDCIAMLSSGRNAIAIPSATNLPLSMCRILAKYSLKMFPDNDEPGLKAFRTLSYCIAREGGHISRLELPAGFKDFGEYYKSICQ